MPSIIIPTESRGQVFYECIGLVFSRWSALKVVQDNDLGGDPLRTGTKIQDLHDSVFEFFEEYKTSASVEDLADNFYNYFEEAFDVELDDDSPDQVAVQLGRVYGAIVTQGNSSVLEELRLQCAKGLMSGQSITEGEEVDMDGEIDSEDDMMMDPQSSSRAAPEAPREPVVDEDGFELVQSRRKSKR